MSKFRCFQCPGNPCELIAPGDMIPKICPFYVRVPTWLIVKLDALKRKNLEG